jgi:diacylglycerol kinase (ATP)
MRVRAILNPRAGLRAHRALAHLDRGCESWRWLEVVETRAPGHARELATESAARGDDLCLAAGGDGTVNEVASGILGSATALAVLPVGSGNGLARTLGMALDAERALVQIEKGVRMRMDVGRVNGRPFLNVAGMGFDAVVAAAFHSWGHDGGRRGILPYFYLGLREFMRYDATQRRMELGGQAVDLPVFLAAFANGCQYGGGAAIAPGARLDDGQIEVVVISTRNRLQVLLGLPRLFFGSLEGMTSHRRWRAGSAALAGSHAVSYHRDGEPEPPTERIDVTLERRALPIVVPAATARDANGPFVAACEA